MNSKPINFYALLGLPQSTEIDKARLDSAYQQLQAQWHPDRFVQASEQERLQAIQQTSLMNDAYRTLKNPLQRAGHLLLLAGENPETHSQNELDGAFLLQQMELRETLDECRRSRDEQALETLEQETKIVLAQQWQAFAASLEANELKQAKSVFHKLQFLFKLQDEIFEVESQLLD